jgi:hypothetical protein
MAVIMTHKDAGDVHMSPVSFGSVARRGLPCMAMGYSWRATGQLSGPAVFLYDMAPPIARVQAQHFAVEESPELEFLNLTDTPSGEGATLHHEALRYAGPGGVGGLVWAHCEVTDWGTPGAGRPWWPAARPTARASPG